MPNETATSGMFDGTDLGALPEAPLGENDETAPPPHDT
jgi:hypothetical protein